MAKNERLDDPEWGKQVFTTLEAAKAAKAESDLRIQRLLDKSAG